MPLAFVYIFFLPMQFWPVTKKMQMTKQHSKILLVASKFNFRAVVLPIPKALVELNFARLMVSLFK